MRYTKFTYLTRNIFTRAEFRYFCPDLTQMSQYVHSTTHLQHELQHFGNFNSTQYRMLCVQYRIYQICTMYRQTIDIILVTNQVCALQPAIVVVLGSPSIWCFPKQTYTANIVKIPDFVSTLSLFQRWVSFSNTQNIAVGDLMHRFVSKVYIHIRIYIYIICL